MLDKTITFDTFVRGILLCLLLIGVFALLRYLDNVLTPFFIAWFVAYLIYPVVTFFQYKLHLRSRILSIFATVLLFIGLVYAFCAFTIPQVSAEVEHFKESATKFLENGSNNTSISPQVEHFIHRQAKMVKLERIITQDNVINVIK